MLQGAPARSRAEGITCEMAKPIRYLPLTIGTFNQVVKDPLQESLSFLLWIKNRSNTPCPRLSAHRCWLPNLRLNTCMQELGFRFEPEHQLSVTSIRKRLALLSESPVGASCSPTTFLM